jgi:HPt (histidine-containing phosphotransfer) domain-containing protein
MANETLPKQFIFNEKLDSEYLFSLYADDFAYMEEVFLTTLQHFDQDFDSLQLAYEAENMADLRKAVHKIKPTFGFTGLLNTQLLCKEFEDKCGAVTPVQDLANDYRQIRNTLIEAKGVIESEYKRLKEFNSNPL